MNENTETQVQDTKIDEGQEVKTYTQEQVDEMLQKETDRRVTQALQKQEKKNAEKMREAEKLARMNESEKFQYELEQREAAIVAKEKELALMENKNEASKILAEKGLSLTLVDFIVAEDAETMKSNIDILTKAFNQSVKAEVEKRMSSSTPKKNLPTDQPIDKKRFMQMSTLEMAELQRDNPQLFEELMRQI